MKINLNVFIKKVFFLFYSILILNLLLLICIYNMQILNFKKYDKLAYNNCTKVKKIYPKRGLILDRNGIILAYNKVYFKIIIRKKKLYILDVNNLSKSMKLSKKIINIIYSLNNNLIHRNSITYKKKFNSKEIENLLVDNFFYPNIKIIKKYKRYYTYSKYISHVLGYISKIDKIDFEYIKKNNLVYEKNNFIGKSGIEKKYEKYLKGKLGYKNILINKFGHELGIRSIKYPKNGYDIYTTIDINLNKYISNLIKNSKAAVVVLNNFNGDIISMVSNPTFNLNKFSNSIYYKKIISNKDSPLLNRVTQGLYSPASTIKPFILFNILNDKIIDKNFLFYDKKFWILPSYNAIYNDLSLGGNRGWINPSEAIEMSSDTFFYNFAYQCGIENIIKYIKNFCYGKKTGIDIEENIGILPDKNWIKNKLNNKWNLGDTIQIGIGQGYFTTTLIQMTKALSILINNGLKINPHILKYKYNNYKNKKIFFKNKKNNNNLLNDKNIDIFLYIKESMFAVSNNIKGTAYNYLKNENYKIASKTGTSQLFSNKNIKISKNIEKFKHLKNHKLLISFAPYDDPIFTVSIILENGGNEKLNHCQIVKKIFDYLILNKENLK